jgi:hypothetical protein
VYRYKLEDDTETIFFEQVWRRSIYTQNSTALSHQHRTQEKDTIKLGNRSFENVANFIYLGTAVRGQRCIIEVMKSRLNLDEACCHSVQRPLLSYLLPKSM